MLYFSLFPLCISRLVLKFNNHNSIKSFKDSLINRKRSLIEFYKRILHQSTNREYPLLDRFRYLCMTNKHCDDFLINRLQNDGDIRCLYQLIDNIYHQINKHYNDIHNEFYNNKIDLGSCDITDEIEEYYIQAIEPNIHIHSQKDFTKDMYCLIYREDKPQILSIPKQLQSFFIYKKDDRIKVIFLQDIVNHFLAKQNGCIFRVIKQHSNNLKPNKYIRLEVLKHLHESNKDNLIKIFGNEINLHVVSTLNIAKLSTITPIIATQKPLRFQQLEYVQNNIDLLSSISKKDMLIHTPYQSFDYVIQMTELAVTDQSITSIKITLYRVGQDSILIQNLMRAARAGKYVIAVIELTAKSDEQTNASIAVQLERSGVIVIKGIRKYKVHAKMLLLSRNDGINANNYAHIGTGNYSQHSAKSYTDFGLLTANKDIIKDIEKIFNYIINDSYTNISLIFHSPHNFYSSMIHAIDKETDAAKNNKPALIIAKMNALTEKNIIDKLYKASQAGVVIRLIVRGPCSLIPQLKSLSENITVKSIVGRFLEHHRIFYFYNDGKEDLFLSSGDWMKRNFFKRVEICLPIIDIDIKKRIIYEGLELYSIDDFDSWYMNYDGDYIKSTGFISAQKILIDINSYGALKV